MTGEIDLSGEPKWRHGALAAVLAGGLMITGCGAQGGETDRPTVLNTPTATSTAPSIGGLGVATIRATPQNPGGCSNIYLIEGEVQQLPEARQHLWIVARLEANREAGAPNEQHYPKLSLPLQEGSYSETVASSTTPGTRNGKYLLIVADDSANAELQLSYEADFQRNTDIYPDGRRVTLPPGSDVVASTELLTQSC